MAVTAAFCGWIVVRPARNDASVGLAESETWSNPSRPGGAAMVVNVVPVEPGPRSADPSYPLAAKSAGSGPKPPPAAAPRRVTDSPDPVIEAGVATSGRAPKSRSVRSPRVDPTPRLTPPSGTLEVGVFPGGNVWIDGQLRGRAPLTLRLSVGQHAVAAGRDVPIETRAVEVTAETAGQQIFNLRSAGGVANR